MCLISCMNQNTSDETETESGQDETSETSTPEALISLFNKDSKFYTKSLNDDSIFSLKTYHHKNYDDVPFVDFEEFHYAIRPYIERNRAFNQIDKDNFVYSSVDMKGKMIFDTKNDVIKYENFNRFLDVIGVNNGIYGDLSQNSIKLYKGSDKTNYITEGHDITIDLKKYGFDLVSENDRLYVSIGVINSVICPLFVGGITYNGKDFFLDSFMRNYDLSVYARSGNYNFSWPLASSECPTAFKRVDTKDEKEAYRFEGIFADRDDRNDQVTMSLFKDGKGALDGTGYAMVHKAMRWRLEDDIIKMTVAQVSSEGDDIEDALSDLTEAWINTKETNYAKKNRSEKMAIEAYSELCLSFDLTYGLRNEKGIESFDKYFSEKNLKDRLLSKDVMVYEDALAEFIYKDIDDIHSIIFGGESVYSASETRAFFRNTIEKHKGPRYKGYYDEVAELGRLRNETSFTEYYTVVGNTACLRFYTFTHNEASCKPITDKEYKTENHEAAVNAYRNAVAANPYKAFAIAFNDLAKMENINNIVIDVTGNNGGQIRCAPYLVAFMSADPSIVVGNQVDGSVIDFHYKVDLNGDGVFGGDGDTFANKYKFYILQGANFSAGNELSTMAKNTGFAKLIGRKSAGGSCVVHPRTDISGVSYSMSSMYRLMLKSGDNYIANDAGIEPDLNIPFDNMFDLEKMDQWFKTLV